MYVWPEIRHLLRSFLLCRLCGFIIFIAVSSSFVLNLTALETSDSKELVPDDVNGEKHQKAGESPNPGEFATGEVMGKGNLVAQDATDSEQFVTEGVTEKESPVVRESPTSDPLIAHSLRYDIETSRRDELEAWCLVLELDNTGDNEDLKKRLLEYYGLENSASSPDKKVPGATRIVIESAGRSEYFKVNLNDKDSESIIRLSGGVVITVAEPEQDRTHRIEADSIIFNQSRNTLSAIGNILYTVNTDGRKERFTGDSISFEVENWVGVIFRGTSTRQQNVDKKTVEFFFKGESIKRSGPDILVLSNGIITSHNVAHPDYALKAKKIWITGPGEWGLLSATLYVGHIPVLYLPFYWKSGRDMFFNPVIGFRSRVGYYLQTTMYLRGQKKKDDSFSIMGFGDSASSGYKLKREGLFLTRHKLPDNEKHQKKTMLKYMLDIYTNLGAMTGFSGDFPKLGKDGSLKFYATIGVSRSIDSNGSIYFNDGTGPAIYWNYGYFGGLVLPFRWGMKVDISLSHWSAYFDWYSDPYYMEDFGNRKENFDWLSLLLGEEGTDQDNPKTVTGMRWEIKGSESFSPSGTAPWLQTLSIDSFKTSFTWKSKKHDGMTKSGRSDSAYNPARLFYYPDRLVLPDFALSLKGGSPQWTINRFTQSEINGDNTEKKEDVRMDNEKSEQNEKEEATPAEPGGPESVPFAASLNAVYTVGLMKASLSYGLKTQFFIENQTRSAGWHTPSEMDFRFTPARINTTQRGDLSYEIDFLDGLTGIEGSTFLSGYYQIHADIFGSKIPLSDKVKLEDHKYSKLIWDNQLTVYVKPFLEITSLSGTSLEYNLDASLFAIQLAEGATLGKLEYMHHWISGEKDFRRHEVSGKINWKPGIFGFSITGSADLPPLSRRFTVNGKAKMEYKGFNADINQQYQYKSSAWKIQPLAVNLSWSGWNQKVKISQTARFDIEKLRIVNAESIVRFWGFETRFVAKYGAQYKWDSAKYVWKKYDDDFAPSTLKFSYNGNFAPPAQWKNRIKTHTILHASWDINLNQPTDNVFSVKLTQKFKVFKFLDLKLSFESKNRSMHLYFPWWREKTGIKREYNFFEDLLKSFNIFNIQDRLDSQFNMDRFTLSLVHHLRNWDLSIDYSGWPSLESGSRHYRWKSEFNLYIKWNPVPMFNQRTKYAKDSWKVDSFKSTSSSK